MPNKTEEYLALACKTADSFSRQWEHWAEFLITAARLYKYSYPDQLMIYAQRPDATACAEYDVWNNKMNRYVRRGPKGIALLERCGLDPAGWFDEKDFQAVYDFTTPSAVYALGTAVSDCSREVLRQIERTVKTTIRRRNIERRPAQPMMPTASQGTVKSFWKPTGRKSPCTRQRKLPLTKPG